MILIIVLLLLFGGGAGYYGFSRGGSGRGGGMTSIATILLILGDLVPDRCDALTEGEEKFVSRWGVRRVFIYVRASLHSA